MFKLNEQKFNMIELKYGPNYGKFNEAYIRDNQLYFDGDSIQSLYDALEDGPFVGEYEVLRPFIGDYLQTGVSGKAILNFASAKYPGGGVRYGSIAQEEDICRNTTLYFYMQNYENDYYKPGKFAGTDYLLDDFVIYSKNVPTVRPDLTLGATNDYITSAAPDLRMATPETFSKRDLSRTWVKRVMLVLGAAAKNGKKELVLGPWGCGVFRNDPDQVAHCFSLILGQYGRSFEKITFLAPDDTNYAQFSRFLKK